jgi:Protein of unknown function (DUF3304)
MTTEMTTRTAGLTEHIFLSSLRRLRRLIHTKRAFHWRPPLLALACFPLAACYGGNETMPVEIVGYNHTDTSIGWFHVNETGGPFIMKHKGGGKFTCCLSIPIKYKPGMTVQVGWGGKSVGAAQERTVAVPPYGPKDGGEFAVHFLRDGQIKVFVTMMSPRHPDYPLKGDEAKM